MHMAGSARESVDKAVRSAWGDRRRPLRRQGRSEYQGTGRIGPEEIGRAPASANAEPPPAALEEPC